MKKTLAFISTHIINPAVISEYNKLSKVKDIDCILLIDNMCVKYEFENRIQEVEFLGTKVKCLFFDEKLNNEMNLPPFSWSKTEASFKDIMWYNADYRYMYARKYFPDYDYYWQFDYDVYCNGTSYEPFFSKYSNRDEDLLICDYREEKREGQWFWSKDVGWIYPQDTIIASFFPISRLSGNAIDYLYNRRIEQAKIYKDIPDKSHSRWLFCEIFVPTELKLANFKCDGIYEKYVSEKAWNVEFDLNDRLFERPDNLLYHPIKGDFINRLKKLKDENRLLQERIKELNDMFEQEKNSQRIKMNILGIKISHRFRNKNSQTKEKQLTH